MTTQPDTEAPPEASAADASSADNLKKVVERAVSQVNKTAGQVIEKELARAEKRAVSKLTPGFLSQPWSHAVTTSATALAILLIGGIRGCIKGSNEARLTSQYQSATNQIGQLQNQLTETGKQIAEMKKPAPFNAYSSVFLQAVTPGSEQQVVVMPARYVLGQTPAALVKAGIAASAMPLSDITILASNPAWDNGRICSFQEGLLQSPGGIAAVQKGLGIVSTNIMTAEMQAQKTNTVYRFDQKGDMISIIRDIGGNRVNQAEIGKIQIEAPAP